MGFIGYLLMGSIVYVVGFMIYQKHLKPKKQAGVVYSLQSPIILNLLALCFVIMLIVSAMIGRFIIGHTSFDWVYILVNSAVATVIFYFGLNPDENNMKLPD